MRKPTWNTLLIALAVVGASAGIPFLFGRPAKLPQLALGSFGFLHVEESAILFFLLSAVSLYVWKAYQGEMPEKAGRDLHEYKSTVGAATRTLQDQVDAIRRQVDAFQAGMNNLDATLDQRTDAAQQEFVRLQKQLEAVEDELGALGAELEAVTDFVTAN